MTEPIKVPPGIDPALYATVMHVRALEAENRALREALEEAREELVDPTRQGDRWRALMDKIEAALKEQAMTEPSLEDIVARFEAGFANGNYGDPVIKELRALIASWRERGKAIEQMRAYQAQLEERIAALKGGQKAVMNNADALQQALYDSMKP